MPKALAYVVVVFLALAGFATLAWASCSAMSSYRQSRPGFAFSLGPSSAEIQAARARASALRRAKTMNRIGAIASREEQAVMRATERRREELERQFSREYNLSSAERERKAEELYEKGERAEARRSMDVAMDYYLFAMQLAPGTQVAVKAHAALKRLDALAGRVANAPRGLMSTSILTPEDLAEIRRAAGSSFAEGEEVQQMLDVLVDEDDARRHLLIVERLRDGKGTEYSNALVQAIAMLQGDSKAAAQKALLDRFVRMTPATLRTKLTSGEPETQIASIKAIGENQYTELVPELIGLLTNKSTVNQQAASEVLRQITGEDFGPPSNASFTDYFAAQQRWNKWWSAKSKEN